MRSIVTHLSFVLMSFTVQWIIITDVSLISKYMNKLKIIRENLSECLVLPAVLSSLSQIKISPRGYIYFKQMILKEAQTTLMKVLLDTCRRKYPPV